MPSPTPRPAASARGTRPLLPGALMVPLVTVLWCVQPVHAQRLDLGSAPTEPKPGEGLAALALADLLETEADRLAEPDPRRAFRTLAADLLRAGENAGPPGAEAILAALTLAARRDELDRLLGTRDAATQRYIADLLAGAERSILPREVDLLLRDALAPLAGELDPRCGWWTTDALDTAPDATPGLADNTAALRALTDNRHLTDDAAGVLAEMVDLFDSAAAHPAYRRDAAEWAALLAAAAGALDEPPDWLDMPARDRLRADFSSGVAMCLDKPAEARAHLSRTAALVRIVRDTDALGPAFQTRELRDAVNRLAAAAEGDPRRDPAAVARIAGTYARALAMLDTDARAPAPTDLLRQARPMLKPLTTAHQLAAATLGRLLPTILTEPDPMTDPGVLAAIGSLQTADDDLRIPLVLTAQLAAWTGDPDRPTPSPSREPVATREAGPLAERVRQLGVALALDAAHAAAHAAQRDHAATAPNAPELPTERDLRANTSSIAWRRVTGDQVDRLLFLIDQARTDWLRSASTDQFAERRDDDRARLAALAAVLPLLRDAADLERLRTDWAREIPPAINAWPGLELTPPALDTLADALTPAAAQLAALTARGDDDTGALARAASLRDDFAAALVFARLDAAARELGAPRCGPAAELGAGAATNAAWMAEHRHALAALSRAAYEAAAAEGDQRRAFFAHANRQARPLLATPR